MSADAQTGLDGESRGVARPALLLPTSFAAACLSMVVLFPESMITARSTGYSERAYFSQNSLRPTPEELEKQRRPLKVDSRELGAESAHTYLRLIERFRLGDSHVEEELLAWPLKQTAVAILSLGLAEPSQTLLEAAVLLHVQTGLSLFVNDSADLASWQVAFARQVINQMHVPARDRWLREFLLLMGYSLQRPGIQPVDGPSMDHFQEALALFPDDAEAALAVGTMYEAVGRLDDDVAQIQTAVEYYQRALTINAEFEEARLRLGATLLALGKRHEALRELQSVLTNTKDSYLLYLGHLFVGDSHRTSGTWPEAVQAYEAAVRAEPEFQTACLSLSHALHRSGYWVLSTEILERCVNLPVDDADYEDGWWRYHLGVSHRAGAILEQWQQEVMK